MATRLLTRMASRTVWSYSPTFLEAFVLLVPRVIGVAGATTDVATIKSSVARLDAAALWEEISEILALTHLL